jgi:hypothetical protein
MKTEGGKNYDEYTTESEARHAQFIKRITEGNRKALKDRNAFLKTALNTEKETNRQIVEEYRKSQERISADKEAALARDTQAANEKTKEQIQSWTGMMMAANQFTRTAVMGTVSMIGNGFANEIVEGTNDWRASLKQLSKQLVSITAQLIIMQGIYMAIGGAGAGPLGFLLGGAMHKGGRVLHNGGPADPLPRHHHGDQIRRNEVPAILERGEFVIRKRAVRQPGILRQLQAINQGRQPASTTVVKQGATVNISIQAFDAAGVEEMFYRSGGIKEKIEQAVRRGALDVGSSS